MRLALAWRSYAQHPAQPIQCAEAAHVDDAPPVWLAIHHDHRGAHHGALAYVDVIAPVADHNPVIMGRDRLRLFVRSPGERPSIHGHACHIHRGAGGAETHAVDAIAAIFLPALHAADGVALTVKSGADGTGVGAARTHQIVTDAALFQIAIADDMAAARHLHAMFGADAARADNAAFYAGCASAALTNRTFCHAVAQRVADRTFAQTSMTIRFAIRGVDLIKARAYDLAATELSVREGRLLSGAFVIGPQAGTWRILVGDDARVLDELVREHPEEAYDERFVERLRERQILGFAT